MIDCPSCETKGCDACAGVGTFEISGCPQAQYVDGDMATLVQLADLYRQGSPPVAGGSLDQESWFYDAAPFLWSEQKKLRPRLSLTELFGD